MSGPKQSLRERAWDHVLSSLFSSDQPDRHVVLDAALAPRALAGLRSNLLSSWAWHYRPQPGYVLCLSPPQSPVIHDVARRLIEIINQFRQGLEVCEEWAFLHLRPFAEFVHSDIEAYVWAL